MNNLAHFAYNIPENTLIYEFRRVDICFTFELFDQRAVWSLRSQGHSWLIISIGENNEREHKFIFDSKDAFLFYV